MTKPAITFEAVAYRPASLAAPVIRDVSCDIYTRKITTVIGPNGAGKTTMIKLLLGLLRPTAGRVTRPARLRIGYVPQQLKPNPALPLTVRDFLSLQRFEDEDSRKTLAAEVKITELQDRMLHQLSGGERQRVLLARALSANPDLLVLDEPTQGVDLAGQAVFYRMIYRLAKERNFGIVLVSHDLHCVMAHTDFVICLNGHVCCSGTPGEVRAHNLYQELFEIPYTHHHDHHHDGLCMATDREGT